MSAKIYWTPEEIAIELGVSGATVRRWIANGLLKALKFGPKCLRVSDADYKTFKESAKVVPEEEEGLAG